MYEHNVFNGENYRAPEEIIKVPVRYSIQNGDSKPQVIKVFKRLMPLFDPNYCFMPFAVSIKKHPQKNLIVAPYEGMDYIMYFDLDNNKSFAIHQTGSPTFNDMYENPGDNDAYFVGTFADSDYVFTLYHHGDYTINESEDRCPELMVFDWNGNFVKSFRMDRQIFGLGYDNIHKKLFTISNAEELFEYDMSTVLL